MKLHNLNNISMSIANFLVASTVFINPLIDLRVQDMLVFNFKIQCLSLWLLYISGLTLPTSRLCLTCRTILYL